MTIEPRLDGYYVMRESVRTDRTWYEGLGWRSSREDHLFVPFDLGGAALSLWDRGIATYHRDNAAAAGVAFHDVVLGLVLETPEQVDEGLATALAAGATLVTAPSSTAFGRSALFADPDGTVWELSWNDGIPIADPYERVDHLDGPVVTQLVSVTLARPDPATSRVFYESGLGWPCRTDGTGTVRFTLRGADLVIRALDEVLAATQDAGAEAAPPHGTTPTFDLGDASLTEALGVLSDQGATVAGHATVGPDGRVSGWLSDPQGVRWELTSSTA